MTTSVADPSASGRVARRGVLLAVLCAGLFLVQLDVTIVSVALPSVGAGLGATVSALQWVVDGYSVPLAALLLISGTLGDRLGHRRVVLTGLVVFGLASCACCAAPVTGGLVVARAAQGVGAALVLPGTLAIINRVFPEPRERARALGVWTGTAALALSAGPLVGGALVTLGGWRAVFVVNVPIVVLAVAATVRLVPADRPGVGGRVDVLGCATATVTLGAVVFAVIATGDPGRGVAVPVAVVVAGAGLVGFVVVERRAAAPVLPLGLLRMRAFVGANVVVGAMNFVGLGMVFVITLHLQRILGLTPLEAGLALLPQFTPLAVLAPVTGRIVARVGPRPPMVAGLLTGVVTMVVLLTMPVGASYLRLLPFLVGLGVGMGLLTTAVVTAAMTSVPVERSGLASGVNNTARQAAGAIGIAVFGTLAGDPADRVAFAAGWQHVAVVGAVLWLIAGIITVRTVRGRVL